MVSIVISHSVKRHGRFWLGWKGLLPKLGLLDDVARLWFFLYFRSFLSSFSVVLMRRMSHSKLQKCITAQENAAKEQRKYQAKLLNLSCFQL